VSSVWFVYAYFRKRSCTLTLAKESN